MVFLLFCTFWKDNVLVLGSYFNGDLIPVLSIYLIGILSPGDIIPFSNGVWKLCIGFQGLKFMWYIIPQMWVPRKSLNCFIPENVPLVVSNWTAAVTTPIGLILSIYSWVKPLCSKSATVICKRTIYFIRYREGRMFVSQ